MSFVITSDNTRGSYKYTVFSKSRINMGDHSQLDQWMLMFELKNSKKVNLIMHKIEISITQTPKPVLPS